MNKLFLALATSSALGAFALVGGCDPADIGPICKPNRCAADQVCIDYKTDMSTGEQCLTTNGTNCNRDDCACIANKLCTNGSAVTCQDVDGGLRLSNCAFPI